MKNTLIANFWKYIKRIMIFSQRKRILEINGVLLHTYSIETSLFNYMEGCSKTWGVKINVLPKLPHVLFSSCSALFFWRFFWCCRLLFFFCLSSLWQASENSPSPVGLVNAKDPRTLVASLGKVLPLLPLCIVDEVVVYVFLSYQLCKKKCQIACNIANEIDDFLKVSSFLWRECFFFLTIWSKFLLLGKK